jgi:translation initiation factor 2 subunit 2
MAAEDEEEMQFDFGKKKGKKEKKEKKEAKGEDGAGEMVGDAEWTKGEEYTYDFLLQRLYETIEAKNPAVGDKKKYVMKPPTTVRVGSKRVGWVNFTEICNMMNRSPDHVMTFVLAEFGTEGSMAGDGQLILKGRYLPKHLESLLRKYIKEFVTCEMCKSANTTLIRDPSTRLNACNCNNCGASRTCSTVKSGYHATTRADRRAAKAAK